MDKSEIMRQAAIISANSEAVMRQEREAIKRMQEQAYKASEEHDMFYGLIRNGMSTREAKRKLERMAKRKKK